MANDEVQLVPFCEPNIRGQLFGWISGAQLAVTGKPLSYQPLV